ncbi:Nuclear transport factor 2 [Cricetulus griseus]|uniref:Nuclear transport factor 2 n=1 Tax=Cricetulus griseus TaxID=10029 RepID=G3IJZ6_CRIGR|nr:Nuclear transport factor 2 [Cricetulus griseus]
MKNGVLADSGRRVLLPAWVCLAQARRHLTWEGQHFQGKAAIVEKLSSLPVQKIQHSITAQDHQPTTDSCIISMVVGQLKAAEDPIMGFHQMFLLKNINDAWVCTNDIHVQARPAQLQLTSTWPDPQAVSSSLLFPIPSHSFRCSKYHTQMSRAEVVVGAVHFCHHGVVHLVWMLE